MSNTDEQVEFLQQAIEECAHKLNEIQLKIFQVKEEINHMVKETNERKKSLGVFQSSGVLERLQQFGKLLQEEKKLTEQLNHEAATERKELRDLHERIEHAKTKKQSIMAKIAELKQRLGEAKDPNPAAQAMKQTTLTRAKKTKK